MSHYSTLPLPGAEPSAGKGIQVSSCACSRCDELLCDYGNALIRLDEILDIRRRSSLGAADFGNYLRVLGECAGLRARLKMHLCKHCC